MPDTNSFVESGVIYSPNPTAVVKDGFVYTQNLNAVLDQTSGNYFTPVNAADPSQGYLQLEEVVVDSNGSVMTKDPTAKIL